MRNAGPGQKHRRIAGMGVSKHTLQHLPEGLLARFVRASLAKTVAATIVGSSDEVRSN